MSVTVKVVQQRTSKRSNISAERQHDLSDRVS